MNGCLITDFVVFSKTKQTMESLQIAACYVIDKDQTFAFSIKIVPLKSQQRKTKSKQNMLLPLGRNSLLQLFLRQPCCDQNCFPTLKRELFLFKTHLSCCILSCQLSVITIYWRLKYKLGY